MGRKQITGRKVALSIITLAMTAMFWACMTSVANDIGWSLDDIAGFVTDHWQWTLFAGGLTFSFVLALAAAYLGPIGRQLFAAFCGWTMMGGALIAMHMAGRWAWGVATDWATEQVGALFGVVVSLGDKPAVYIGLPIAGIGLLYALWVVWRLKKAHDYRDEGAL